MARHRFSTFWSGKASPYQTLCLASWVAHGFDVTVYTSGAEMELPAGVRQRPAEEILDLGGHVHRYKTGFGAGSPSLHSNLFRYKLLLRGEWWLDTDVVVLRDQVPDTDFFLAKQGDRIGTAVMRLPPDLPLVREAITEALDKIDNAKWTEIGPALITRLVREHGLSEKLADRNTAFAIHFTEFTKFFDPSARSEVEERVASSTFVHLWNEMWNAIGFPQELGPPEGSYLDALFETYIGKPVFKARVPFSSISKWWAIRQRSTRLEEELARANAKLAARATAPTTKPIVIPAIRIDDKRG